MALNPQFPNYANGPAGTEVIGWTVVGGQPLYRLPVAYVNTGFGAAFVCEGSTLEAPTYPEGVYEPDPYWESAGEISGTPQVGQTLTFIPGAVTGTQPITETYNWIRYLPGGQSVIVGTGLNYSPVEADLSHSLVVQSVAVNAVAATGIATQTLPFGPIVPAAPVITNAGTITSDPPNQGGGGTGAVSALTLTNPGQDYVYLLGAPTLTINGDGTGATATATLAEEGTVIAATVDNGTCQSGSSGTITYAGEGSETDIVLNWADDGSGVIAVTVASGGSGWTQANAFAAQQLSYGTRTVTNEGDWITTPDIGLFIGVPLAGVTLTDGGSGYTTAGVTITPVEGDVFGNGAIVTATVSGSGGSEIFPGQVAVYSGATVTGYNPTTSWVWGYGAGADFVPVQLGGLTFSPITADRVNQTLYVRVTATNIGGTVTEFSAGINVSDVAPTPVRLPRIGPQDVNVGDTLTGEFGTWDGYPRPQVTDWGFAEFLLPTPVPIAGANKVRTYKVPDGSGGKQYVFYVTAENVGGSYTAYSLPTDAAYYNLAPEDPPTLTGYQSPAQYGDVLRATPGTFSPPVAYQYSYFAYVETDGTLTEIAGTRDTTTYTLGTADQTKQIVYASYAENQGKYGLQTLTTRSPSTGIIRRFPKITGNATMSWTGDFPLIGSQVTFTTAASNPPIGTAGVQMRYSVFYVVQEGGSSRYVYFINSVITPTGTGTFTVPVEADGHQLGLVSQVSYYDGVATTSSLQTDPNLTPPAEGVRPYIVTPGGYDPTNQYNPGLTIAFTPDTFAGVPTPTVTWYWLRRLPNNDEVMLQNGGLTYTLPDDSAGWKVGVHETARNQAGQSDIYFSEQTVGGPLPIFYRQPLITGDGLMTPTQSTTLNAIIPLARDPITGNDIPVVWKWMLQYPGQDATPLDHPFTTYQFLNEGGKWTGAEIFIKGTATNTIGTVTCESNHVTLLGTPRLISGGTSYGASLPNRFGINTSSFFGATSQTWEAGITGGPSGSITNPSLNGAVIGTGTGTILAQWVATNSQGSTVFDYAPVTFTWN